MDYKDEYIKTAEQLYFAVRELEQGKRKEETNYMVLCLLSSIISALWESLDRLPVERKINAETTMQKLIQVFMHLGKFYMDELNWRKQLFAANKGLIDAAETIKGLKKEIEKLNELNNF